jgi:hypothetical protein
MSVKSVVRVSVAVLALLGLAGHARGPGAAAAPQEAAPSASPAPAVSPVSPPAAPGKDPLIEFVPREHVPADSAVSFPVDI